MPPTEPERRRSTRDERRERWRADLESLAKRVGRRLAPWQLDVAAELFVSRLPAGSCTGAADIWSTTQLAASTVTGRMRADGRLNEWGNWPATPPQAGERSEGDGSV